MILRGGATLYTVLRSAVGVLLLCLLCLLGQLAVVAPLKEKRLPERFGRVLWLPTAPCDRRQQECAALRTLDAGALRQQFGAGLGTNIAARTPRSALEPSPSLTDLFSPPVAAHWTGG